MRLHVIPMINNYEKEAFYFLRVQMSILDNKMHHLHLDSNIFPKDCIYIPVAHNNGCSIGFPFHDMIVEWNLLCILCPKYEHISHDSCFPFSNNLNLTLALRIFINRKDFVKSKPTVIFPKSSMRNYPKNRIDNHTFL